MHDLNLGWRLKHYPVTRDQLSAVAVFNCMGSILTTTSPQTPTNLNPHTTDTSPEHYPEPRRRTTRKPTTTNPCHCEEERRGNQRSIKRNLRPSHYSPTQNYSTCHPEPVEGRHASQQIKQKSPGHNTRGFSKNLSVQPTLVLSQSLKSRLVQVETRTHRRAKSHLLDQWTLHTLRLSPKNRRVNARKII